MPGRRFLIALGGVFFLVVLVRTAWLSELSYLTLRTIEHAARGHGLRWNITERVQVFDHPLWMLLLLAGRAVTGESYFTTFVISLAASAATAVLVLGNARRAEGVVLGAMLLSLSWAIVTYSTSGLEGPLAHLVVVSFCLAWLAGRREPHRVQALAGLAGLAAVTHAATLLITGPALIAALSRGGGRPHRESGDDTLSRSREHRGGPTEAGATAVRSQPGAAESVGVPRILATAATPLLAWAVFATFYYGTPIPTPVIAEWADHTGLAARAAAAARLFTFVLRHDPITLAIIGTAIATGLRARSSTRPLAIGVIVYGVLLAAWAGDGMPGRWLALPCLVSILILVQHPALGRRGVFGAAVAASIVLAAVPPLATVQSDVRFGTAVQSTSRQNPRAADYRVTGLLLDIRQWYPPHHPEATRGGIAWQDSNRVKTSPHPAFFGFAAGYGVHVIDRTGRTDPLLARLRPDDTSMFPAGAARRIPDGYEASLPDKANAIANPVLAAYYDRVRLVTRGSLWDPSRIVAAVRLAIARPPEAPRQVGLSARRPARTTARP